MSGQECRCCQRGLWDGHRASQSAAFWKDARELSKSLRKRLVGSPALRRHQLTHLAGGGNRILPVAFRPVLPAVLWVSKASRSLCTQNGWDDHKLGGPETEDSKEKGQSRRKASTGLPPRQGGPGKR